MTTVKSITTSNRQKRTNTRPCDACAVRRVRCDLQTSVNYRCTNCTNHDIECTNIRIRHKSGPKKIKDKTRESIKNLISGTTEGSIDISHNGGTQPLFSVLDNSGLMVYKQPNNALEQDHNTTYNKEIALNSNAPNAIFCLNQLLPYLQIYQTWFYGIWPVLSVANLITKLSIPEELQAMAEDFNNQGPAVAIFSNSDPIKLNETNISSYALCCAVNATISRHKVFIKSTSTVINLINCPTSKDFAEEATRVMYLFDLRAKPSVETLLTCMFLHIYYCNCPNEEVRALVYLREAVTFAHIMRFHDPTYVLSRASAESHKIRKVYYLLLMVERFFSIENQYSPALLDASIPIPNLKDEEYPDLLHGFIEIIRVFSATDKRFLQEITTQHESNSSLLVGSGETSTDSLTNLTDFFNQQQNSMPPAAKKQWLQQLQTKLSNNSVEFQRINNDSQRVNILLSKAWFKSLCWLISSQNYLINNFTSDDCFTMKFPLKIANEFLSATAQCSDFAFEQNGPGVACKLLEISNSVYTYTLFTDDNSLAFDQLNTLHGMIMKFKVDMEISNPMLQKISEALEFRRFGYRQLDHGNPEYSNEKDQLYEINQATGEVDDDSLDANDLNNDQPLIIRTNSSNSNNSTANQSRSSSSTSVDSILDTSIPASNEVNGLIQSWSNSYSGSNLASLINYPCVGGTPGFSPTMSNILAGDNYDSPVQANGVFDQAGANNRGLGFYLSPFLQGFGSN